MISARTLDPVFHLILDLSAHQPAPGVPTRLRELFGELSEVEAGEAAQDVEELIWTLWTSHEDRDAEEIMAEAIEGMEVGALDAARILLDDLTERYPDWAEAWNRRATLCFIEQRDADCLADIERTLALEPRHFGAISDFGHVCLRHGHLNEARAAFQIALSINPHLEDLGEILEDLAPHNLMLH
jgi:tetratricopeptide (TPR) repeat protein